MKLTTNDQQLINKLTQASASDQPTTLSHNGKPLALIIPIEDYKKFKEEQAKKLESVKVELDGLLSLVRGHLASRTLEDVEQELMMLRQEIEQAMD